MHSLRETLYCIGKSESNKTYIIIPEIIKTRKMSAFRYFQVLGQITLSKLPGLFCKALI